jgi:hypothetical protein
VVAFTVGSTGRFEPANGRDRGLDAISAPYATARVDRAGLELSAAISLEEQA